MTCGGFIAADPGDPAAVRDAVLAHVRTERHALARERRPTKVCERCRMVTLPAWRSLCHGCQRAAQVAA